MRDTDLDSTSMVPGGSAVGRRAVLAGLSSGALALAGCSSVAGGTAGSRLRIGTIQPPVTLDPIVAGDVGSAQAIERIFDGLYTYGPGTEIVPQIADGQPSPTGGDALTVSLGEARFQDGRPVTPGDVRYSFEAPQREDAPAKWAVSPIESVEVVDDRTIRFVLEAPFPGFDHALTRPIVPEHVREADPERFASDPLGAGPYRVGSFDEEKKVELTRWDDYWGEPTPAIETVSLVYIESPITQMTSLVSGRTDAIEPISPRFRRQIRDLTGASVAEVEGFRSFFFGFNLNEGPTTDRAVREGIVRCIDLDEAVSEFVEPVGERQMSLLPRRVAEEWGFPVEEWAAAVPPKDSAEAKRYFDRARSPVGTIRILTSKDPVWKELAEALASGLRDANQSVLVEDARWKKYLDRSLTGAKDDYSVFVGEVAGAGDPDSFLYPVFHENVEGLTNGIFYHEDDVMDRLEAARKTTDHAKRASLYESAITTLIEERVHLPVCSFQNSFAHESSVRGFEVHPIAGLNPRVTRPGGVMRIGAPGDGGGR